MADIRCAEYSLCRSVTYGWRFRRGHVPSLALDGPEQLKILLFLPDDHHLVRRFPQADLDRSGDNLVAADDAEQGREDASLHVHAFSVGKQDVLHGKISSA